MKRTIHFLISILIVSGSLRAEAKVTQHQEHVNTFSTLIGSLGEDLLLNSGFLSKSSKIEIVNHSSIQFQKVDSSRKINFEGVTFNLSYTSFFKYTKSLDLAYSLIIKGYRSKLYKVFCNYRL
jgi:hypothetical protein